MKGRRIAFSLVTLCSRFKNCHYIRYRFFTVFEIAESKQAFFLKICMFLIVIQQKVAMTILDVEIYFNPIMDIADMKQSIISTTMALFWIKSGVFYEIKYYEYTDVCFW